MSMLTCFFFSRSRSPRERGRGVFFARESTRPRCPSPAKKKKRANSLSPFLSQFAFFLSGFLLRGARGYQERARRQERRAVRTSEASSYRAKEREREREREEEERNRSVEQRANEKKERASSCSSPLSNRLHSSLYPLPLQQRRKRQSIRFAYVKKKAKRRAQRVAFSSGRAQQFRRCSFLFFFACRFSLSPPKNRTPHHSPLFPSVWWPTTRIAGASKGFWKSCARAWRSL